MVLGFYGYDIGEGKSFLSRLKDYLMNASPGQGTLMIAGVPI
jgi:hypothetical protein